MLDSRDKNLGMYSSGRGQEGPLCDPESDGRADEINARIINEMGKETHTSCEQLFRQATPTKKIQRYSGGINITL